AAIALTAGYVADAAEGRLAQGDPSTAFARVSTDSRALSDAAARDGALFIALKGPNFDGITFAVQLLRDGAAGVMVSGGVQDPSALRTQAIITVDDTLIALQNIARRVRRDSAARVVAITGSAGKTTTKEMTAELLAARYRVFRNSGNL